MTNSAAPGIGRRGAPGTSSTSRSSSPRVEPDEVTALTAPPAGSGIELGRGTEGTVIRLPRIGLSTDGLLGILFSAGSFTGLGAVILLSGLERTDPGLKGVMVGLIFIAIGLGLTLAVVAGSRIRERIEDRGEALAIASRLWGRRLDSQWLAKSEIEAIELRPGEELFLRTDSELVRLAGDLGPETGEWLRRAVTALVEPPTYEPSASRHGDAELQTDPPRGVVGNFAMPGDGGSPLLGRFLPDRMGTAFAKQLTAVAPQVSQQVTPLHGASRRAPC